MRRKISKEKKYFGFLIDNYFATCLLLLTVALFVDANIGFYMMVAFFLAPVISVILTLIARKGFKISIDVKEHYYSKYEYFSYDVIIQSNMLLPTPPILLELYSEGGIRFDDKKIIVSALPFGKKVLKQETVLETAGPFKIGVKEAYVSDYLGLFKFKLKLEDKAFSQINVIPEIKDVSGNDDLILSAITAAESNDDSEDTVESRALNFRGFPGYDTREYVPGDPIKRINWKLSARKEKYYIRLDDELSSKTIGVVLDPYIDRDSINIDTYYQIFPEDVYAKIDEEAVETYLGIIRTFVRLNYSVTAYYYDGTRHIDERIRDEKGLEELRIKMASVSFSASYEELPGRCPRELIEKNKDSSIVISTPVVDGNLATSFTGYTPKIYDASTRVGDNYYNYESVKNKKSDKLMENLKKFIPYLLPALLSLVLSFAVFEVYGIENTSGWALAQIGVVAFSVMYAGYVNKHRIVGTITTIVLAAFSLGYYYSTASQDYLQYQQWFMSGADAVDNNNRYLFTLLFMFTPFFALVCYYFSNVLYRMSLLALTSVIPIILYAKVGREIKFTYIVFITALNIAVFVLHNKEILHKERRIKGPKTLGFSFAIFALVLLALTEAMPKSRNTKYYYIFEDMFLGGNFEIMLPDNYSEMNDTSGNADNFNQYSNRRLYTIYQDGEMPMKTLYFKRQVFDYYDFDNDFWRYDEEYMNDLTYIGKMSERLQYRSGNRLLGAFDAVRRYNPSLIEKYDLTRLINEASIDGGTYVLMIQATNFPSVAFLSTTGTVECDDSDCYVNKNGVFMTAGKTQYGYNYYGIALNNDLSARQNMIRYGGCNYSLEECIEMYDEMLETEIKSGRQAAVIKEWKQMTEEAIAYRELCKENTDKIPQRIKDLAADITKDCTYDYEKANALVDWFFDEGFVYDLDYKAPDDSVEYFLFTGKTGTCSDFASAYVLMARSVGLSVRYVEGYVPDPQSINGSRVIKTTDAHAYPEVFIANLGYVVFEPTVPSEYNGRSNGGFNIDFRFGFSILRFLAMVLVAMVMIGTIIIILKPFVLEIVFRLKVRRKSGDSIAKMYRRLNGKSAWLIKNPQSLTPIQYTAALKAMAQIDIKAMSDVVSDKAYKDKEYETSAYSTCYKLYTKARGRLNILRFKKRFEKKR